MCFPSTFQHVASKPLCKLVFAQSDVSPAEYTFLTGSAMEASCMIFLADKLAGSQSHKGRGH